MGNIVTSSRVQNFIHFSPEFDEVQNNHWNQEIRKIIVMVVVNISSFVVIGVKYCALRNEAQVFCSIAAGICLVIIWTITSRRE